MKKLLFTILFLSLVFNYSFGVETLPGEDYAAETNVLNEQLRIISRAANGVHTTNLASTSSITGTLPTSHGGTGSTANANAAGGVVVPTGAVNSANGAVVLNASSQLPAVSGALLTNVGDMSYANARTKLGSITRVKDAVSGDVSYTGIGFKPKLIQFIAVLQANPIQSIGWDDGTTHFNVFTNSTALDYCAVDSSVRSGFTNGQRAIVKTFDDDGFTLTWTKISGGAAENLTVYYIAFR